MGRGAGKTVVQGTIITGVLALPDTSRTTLKGDLVVRPENFLK